MSADEGLSVTDETVETIDTQAAETAAAVATVETPAPAVATAATALFTYDLPPSDLLGLVPKIGGATFFVYGEEGQSVEQPANEAFYAAARGTKEIWEVPGSGHMKGIEAQPAEYERRVVGFFDRTLRPDRGSAPQ